MSIKSNKILMASIDLNNNSIKSKGNCAVTVLNGEVLHAEHFDEIRSGIENWSTNILKNIQYELWGINTIQIDQLALTQGKLIITKLDAIFPDMSYINYNSIDNKFDILFNLSEIIDKLSGAKKFYLKMENDLLIQKPIKSSLGEIITMNFKQNKIIISDKFIENALPFIEIIFRNNSYEVVDFAGPILNIKNNQIFSDMEKLALLVKNAALFTKRDNLNQKGELYSRDLVYLSTLNKIYGVMSNYLMNYSHPRIFYNMLFENIYAISWKQDSDFINIPKYDHFNCINCLKSLVAITKDLLITNDYESEHINMIKENNKMVCIIENLFDAKEILIFVELMDNNSDDLNDINMRTWIENIPIVTESMLNIVAFKRISGISRKITYHSSSTIVVSLDMQSEFLSRNDKKLIVLCGEQCLVQLNVCIKK